MGSDLAEPTAAGLLTLGWPHGGGTMGRFGFALIISLDCVALTCFRFACETRERFCQKGRKAIPKREAFVFRLGDRFVGLLSLSCFGFCCRVGRPTMLRMLSNVFVSPPTHRVYPVRLCHSWCWLRGCRSCVLIRSIQALNNDQQGPLIL